MWGMENLQIRVLQNISLFHFPAFIFVYEVIIFILYDDMGPTW